MSFIVGTLGDVVGGNEIGAQSGARDRSVCRRLHREGHTGWKFSPGFDLELPLDFPASLAASARRRFLKYSYISPVTGHYILCSDDARFFNHSDDPNVISTPVAGEQEGMDIAARDVNAGEELLYDYRVFGERPGR